MKSVTFPRFLLMALLSGTVLLSCKKENDPFRSQSLLLTRLPWKQIKMERKSGPLDTWTDVTSSYLACDLDNIITFFQDHTYTETEGATKCVSTDPDELLNGYWRFESGGTVLRMQVALLLGSLEEPVMEVLDESTLVLGYYNPSLSVYLRVTMKH